MTESGESSQHSAGISNNTVVAILALLSFISAVIIILLFFRLFRCVLEYRMSDEATVGLVAGLIASAGVSLINIASPPAQKALRCIYLGIASPLIFCVLVAKFLPPPPPNYCPSILPPTIVTSHLTPTSTSTPALTAIATPDPMLTPTNTLVVPPADTFTPEPPTSTPKPIDTSTPTPTDTPFPNTPTPTLTVTPTPTPKPEAMVKEVLDLRSGPSKAFDVLGELKQGDLLMITGKNLSGDWLKVICPGGQKGWAACSLLQVNVDMAGVPVGEFTPLPPPTPLAPANGECFIGGTITFRWQWDRPLAPDELFSLRVYREGETKPCHHDKTQGLEYSGHLSYCTAGKHYWRIALVRKLKGCPDEQDEKCWENLSEPSEKQWIYYTPGEEPWVRVTQEPGEQRGRERRDEDGRGRD